MIQIFLLDLSIFAGAVDLQAKRTNHIYISLYIL